MIGDIVLIQDMHIRKAEFIFPKLIESVKGIFKPLVTIGAPSGTGKTEIAILLQRMLWERLKIKCKIVHIDDYYLTDYHTRDKIRKETGVIGKEEINWKKLNNVIRRYKRNERKLYVQRIHRFLDGIEHTISPGHLIDLLILEGLYANYCILVNFGIYLDGNEFDTYSFRKERGKEDPDDLFRKEVLRIERECVEKSKKFADLVVPFRLGIESLK